MLVVGIVICIVAIVLLVPIIFPIQDVGVGGFIYKDNKSKKWCVCLTDGMQISCDTPSAAVDVLNELTLN